MTRKLIAAFLIFAMLIPYSSAVAADKEAVTPTVEEILNEYHQKSFEAQQARETGTASANSRSGAGSGKTLEQETVETLTAAGYEAYNVTADNYETLETQLQTDFAAMGLDPNSSYIVVVHGEEPNTPANNARGPSDIVQDPGDLSGGAPPISYTYDGTTYYMRYVTVTAADNNQLGMTSNIELLDMCDMQDFNEYLGYAVSIATLLPGFAMVGVVYDLFGLVPDSELPLFESMLYRGATNWTVTYVQVYDFLCSEWRFRYSVEYVTMRFFTTSTYYDSETNAYKQLNNSGGYPTAYSANYNNTELIKYYAAIAAANNRVWLDEIPEVKYKWGDEIVITHQRWMEPLDYEPQ